MGDTLNCSQECYPVRGKNGRKKQSEMGGEKERGGVESKRERGQEDKPVWQVCVTVHSPSCKADGKRTERKELGSDVIALPSL